MKRMHTSLIDFLTSNPSCIKADLFAVTLPNGTVMYATDGQWDITVPASVSPIKGAVVNLTVSGEAMPWKWNAGAGLNTSYEWGTQDGLDPVVLTLSGATAVTITASGTVSAHFGSHTSGPDGIARDIIPGTTVLPSQYAGSPLGDKYMNLVGAFCDSSGNVIQPVLIGSSVTLTVPSGATQLQLGINDTPYNDNGGSFSVTAILEGVGVQTTFKAAQYGRWSRGKIVSEAGTKVNANTMDLTCIPQPGTTYPGSPLGILNAALNHLFDGATVWVFTAYMPMGQYGNVSAGIEVKFQGTVTLTSSIARNKVVFQCADPLYLLNMKVPSRLFQAACPWGFTDVNCTLTPSDYTVTFTADSSSTQMVLEPTSAFSQADGYFNQGVITCLTGLNAGLSQTVKSHAGGKLSTVVAWLLPVSAGDTFSVIKGCDKTLGMCKTTKKANGTVIDNTANFGGTPFVPAPQTGI